MSVFRPFRLAVPYWLDHGSVSTLAGIKSFF